MKARKILFLLIIICFGALVAVGVNIYAKNDVLTEMDTDMSNETDPTSDNRENDRVLIENPIEKDSEIQEDAVGTDAVGGSYYVIPNSDGEDRILMESPSGE